MKKVAPLAAALVVSSAVWLFAGTKVVVSQKADLVLRVTPAMAFAPARVTLRGQLNGGPNDNAELYCPTVEWDWGDGTVSQSSSDCDPFEPNKTQIKRTFVTDHVYKYGGEYVVQLRLKKQNRVVATASANLNIGLALGQDDVIR